MPGSMSLILTTEAPPLGSTIRRGEEAGECPPASSGLRPREREDGENDPSKRAVRHTGKGCVKSDERRRQTQPAADGGEAAARCRITQRAEPQGNEGESEQQKDESDRAVGA